ncbi:tumor necrosis factor receptor superfamily member 6B-like isoform X2 [Cololabis saira]|uniref:tumor necrosis factor receptor superfamily member 6B-like isoform X2 n=1 Tax=Cololabis saira TaxID=129043 RepID=UPI002AD46578|nr:tumor necrosis factor receptor superfamily member 6B-like isoform X2 [Cololabis saira]
MTMLSLVVMLLFPAVHHGLPSSAVDVPTYEHQDPSTGETLACEKCPPGSHMVAHCTANTRTKCQPCKSDHFTELWNYLPRCLYCNNFCSHTQEVETECSPVNNRVCRCVQGYYLMDDFCIRQSECGAGYGVQSKGTSKEDTVCEKCSDGFFSNSSSAVDSCVKHQECAGGELALLPGSNLHDTVCGTCKDLENGGETLRTFLAAFFSAHRMGVRKMKRFVARNMYSSDEERGDEDASLTEQRGPLLGQIRAWLADAPVEKLRRIPQMLRAVQVNSMADKLDKRFSEIQEQSLDCTLTLK